MHNCELNLFLGIGGQTFWGLERRVSREETGGGLLGGFDKERGMKTRKEEIKGLK